MAELAQTITCQYSRPFVELHMAEDGSVVYIRTDAIQTIRREKLKYAGVAPSTKVCFADNTYFTVQESPATVVGLLMKAESVEEEET